MYLLVLDYGYEGYSTREYDTLAEAVDAADSSSALLHMMYEIKREITLEDIAEYRKNIHKQREDAIEKAKSKLTAEELALLGIS